jgi:hypothetical protein
MAMTTLEEAISKMMSQATSSGVLRAQREQMADVVKALAGIEQTKMTTGTQMGIGEMEVGSREKIAGMEQAGREKLTGMELGGREKLLGMELAGREKLQGLVNAPEMAKLDYLKEQVPNPLFGIGGAAEPDSMLKLVSPQHQSLLQKYWGSR